MVVTFISVKDAQITSASFLLHPTAVVRKDSEAYHQWSTYWLILYLYIIILAPLLHLTLHPIFQIIAILWLALPQYQGASVVYERIVTPWVDQYESRVDEAVNEANRGVRRWFFRAVGRFSWLLIGEGGTLAQGLLTLIVPFLGDQSARPATSGDDVTPQPSKHNESLISARHSMREALSQSSFEEITDVSDSSFFNPTNEFVEDFTSMLNTGLYVFANVNILDEATDSDADMNHAFAGGFFSLSEQNRAFLVSTTATCGAHAMDDANDLSPVLLPLDALLPLRTTGTQGLVLECHCTSDGDNGKKMINIRAEIVLSDETDRNILMNGLNACLECLIS